MAVVLSTSAGVARDLAQYNIVWDSPSKDATGSMPLSGGNLGLNVWIEGDDLLFYISHPDSRIESGQLVKLGRVRLSLDPSPFRANFRQELDLASSSIRISSETATLKLWVDAFQPVVHCEMESAEPVTAAVAFESWRFTGKTVSGGIEWCHRNDAAKDQRALEIKQQHAEAVADKVPDLLNNLTMGGRIVADGLIDAGVGEGTYMKTQFRAWKAKTVEPVKKFDLRVLLRVEQDASEAAWREGLDKLERTTRATARADRERTEAWWREFWGRSHIVIRERDEGRGSGARDRDRPSTLDPPSSPAWQVGRNYQLFRYLLACNRTGRSPTLFNGGIFTFDNPLPDATAFGAAGPSPDERAWWGCHFMAQNQRLVYWPMLKSGDFDLLKVGLDFYRDRAELQEARARHFFGVGGTPFPESIDLLGLMAACPSVNGHHGCEHLTYHYTSALEFAFMMLEQCRFADADVERSLPVVLGVLKFYDEFYQKECKTRTGKPLDDSGKLVIYPGNSCEMGVGCKNHADAIAGLIAIAEGVLKLPVGRLPAADRAWLASFQKRIPAIPTSDKNGHKIIALAESWAKIANPNEFPQLYTLFPFHRYGVGLPDLDLALNTWRYGAFNAKVQKEALCWKYGNIGVAELGLASEAKDYCLKKFLYPFGADGGTAHYGNCAQFTARFPAFWVTYSFDAFPDMDHGGCAMIGLQEMLMQTPGERILLFPAWPGEWDVDFKLHAPKQTTVECELRAGKVVKLTVVPESRRKDVELLQPQEPPEPPVPPVSAGKAATAFSTYARSPGYEADKAFDGDLDTRWSAEAGTHDGWLEVDLGQDYVIDRAMIDETSYPNVAEFALEYRAGDAWKEMARGTTIGSELYVTFDPVRARRVRLHILRIKDNPDPNFVATINEFQLFRASPKKDTTGEKR
jgi:hypothetical protein